MQHVQQLERDWQKNNTEKEMEKRQDLQQHFGLYICTYRRVESVCINAATASFIVFAVAVC